MLSTSIENNVSQNQNQNETQYDIDEILKKDPYIYHKNIDPNVDFFFMLGFFCSSKLLNASLHSAHKQWLINKIKDMPDDQQIIFLENRMKLPLDMRIGSMASTFFHHQEYKKDITKILEQNPNMKQSIFLLSEQTFEIDQLIRQIKFKNSLYLEYIDKEVDFSFNIFLYEKMSPEETQSLIHTEHEKWLEYKIKSMDNEQKIIFLQNEMKKPLDMRIGSFVFNLGSCDGWNEMEQEFLAQNPIAWNLKSHIIFMQRYAIEKVLNRILVCEDPLNTVDISLKNFFETPEMRKIINDNLTSENNTHTRNQIKQELINDQGIQLSYQEYLTKLYAKRLSGKEYRKIQKIKIKNDKKKQCSICYETYKKDQIIFRLPCKHLFHRPCLKNWIKQHKSCPFCRDDITKSLKT